MAKFQNQQKMFMQQAKMSAGGDDLDESDEDESDTDQPLRKSDVSSDTAESQPPAPTENLPKCTLCRTSLSHIHDPHHKPMGLISFVQRSNVLATAQARARCDRWWSDFSTVPRERESDTYDAHDVPDLESFDVSTQWREYRKAVVDVYARLRRRDDYTIHTQSCGHCIHVECFARYEKSGQFWLVVNISFRYYDSMVKRHLQGLSYEGLGIIDLSRGQFLCPVCRYNIS